MVLGEVAKSSMLCLQTLMSLHMVQTQESTQVLKRIIQKKKKLVLIIYLPPCHPSHSFFSRKEIKVFVENIPGFFSI